MGPFVMLMTPIQTALWRTRENDPKYVFNHIVFLDLNAWLQYFGNPLDYGNKKLI